MRLRSATVALLALALSWAASDACARSRERISGAYSVDGLGLGEPVVPDSWAYKRYKCARSEQYAEAVFCKFKEVKDGAVQSTTILHRLDNTAIYINRDISPAFFDIAGVEDEIGRLSKRFGKPRQILQSTRGIIAIWGGIELRSVSPAAASVLARGKSPKLGFLVDFLDNFEDFLARSGSPVYQLEGGPGFVWAASFKSGAHKSSLRFFAADPAQMRRLPSPYDAPPSDEATPPAARGPGRKRHTGADEFGRGRLCGSGALQRGDNLECRGRQRRNRRQRSRGRRHDLGAHGNHHGRRFFRRADL